MAGAVMLAATVNAAPGRAGTECNSAASIIGKDVSKQMATFLLAAGCAGATGNWAACYATAHKWTEIAEQSVNYFNKMAGNSWARLGARSIVLGSPEQGTIVGTAGRIYVTTTTLPSSSARIIVTERGGKGKVGVAICKADAGGQMARLEQFVLNASKAEKKQGNQRVEVTVAGVKDSVLQIHLDGKSASNSLKYKIEVVPLL
jgi:hypothetical protein